MSIAFRILSGALGLASLVGTAGMALHLLAMDFAGEVLLAGYMGIGGILLGVSFLIYAITGRWHPNPDARQE